MLAMNRVARPMAFQYPRLKPKRKPDDMDATASGPGEMEMAQEVAKRVSQAERDMMSVLYRLSG